jgi:signal transduction histidine kinase/ActR/RegA family two-component response regulator
MSWPIAAMSLRSDENVVAARRLARKICEALAFDLQDQTRIATTVSEISRNAVSYASGGQIDFALDGEAQPQILWVTVRDKGPGISNLDDVYAGKFQSRTGMGNGILGARRLMDEFSIETGGAGTKVAFAKRRPRDKSQLARDQLAKFVRSIPADVPDAQDELKEQNRELLQSLQELKSRSEELESLASELESTNRGVVALHGELESSAQELRRASELKTRFLSNMSHEFRTPLNSILALTRLLLARTDGELTAEQEKQVRYIADAAVGLTELVNDLLDIAKVEAGKLEVKASRFSVSDLFGALRGLLRPLKTNEDVELIFEEPAGVPILFNDEGKVTQILRNFISNALKYTPAGAIRVSALFKEPDRILFAVQDTGIGIPKEFQDLIFQEFEQVPGIFQVKHRGTGLGLPLSRRLAELLRGTVAVDSAPGKGSTFFLDLPVRWSAEGSGPIFPESLNVSLRPRVLIADDEEAFRYVMRRMIDVQQYEIIEVADGEAALMAAQSAHPDIIILDVNLPERDGYAVLHELASEDKTRGIPVIISTSLVLSDRDRVRLAHSYAILSKAVLSTDLLSAMLSDALKKRSAS